MATPSTCDAPAWIEGDGLLPPPGRRPRKHRGGDGTENACALYLWGRLSAGNPRAVGEGGGLNGIDPKCGGGVAVKFPAAWSSDVDDHRRRLRHLTRRSRLLTSQANGADARPNPKIHEAAYNRHSGPDLPTHPWPRQRPNGNDERHTNKERERERARFLSPERRSMSASRHSRLRARCVKCAY